MTTDILDETRKSYLTSLKDPQATSALLLDLLAQAQKQTPELLDALQLGTGESTMDPDATSWGEDYFSRHMRLTRHNFARERIEHLLKVRDHLRKQGVKGFVPSNSPTNTQVRSTDTLTSHYAPSANLQKFVAEGDLPTIRTALRMELNDNSLTGADLRATLSWAKVKVAGLLDAYSEKSFARGMEANRTLWTSEYYETQVVYVKTNFCEERFLHLIEVRDLLRQQGVEGFAAVPPKPRVSTTASHAAPTPTSLTAQAQAQRQSSRSQRPNTQYAIPERNPAFKAAWLVGGALAALVVFLIALMK